MKLLLYSYFFAPSVGGVETIVLSLARGLAALRDSKGSPEFDITLATQTARGDYDDGSLAFQVVRKPNPLRLWKLIRRADVVHVAGPAVKPLFLAKIAGKPLVIEHHGYQATCPNGLLFYHPSHAVCPGHFEAGNYEKCLRCNEVTEGGFGSLRLLFAAFLRRALSHCASTNVAPSHYVAARQRLPRTVVIHHGVTDPLPSHGAMAANVATERGSFAYLGRLVVEKGVSVLLEAARLLRAEGREVRVTVIGDGPDRPRLEKQIAASKLQDTVCLTGFLTGEALERELRHASTIVIPTIMEETAGLAALEQMARGRPIICSAVGGLQEAVDGAGLTFPPADAEALGAAMKRISDEPSFAGSLGAAGRRHVLDTFTFDGMIDAHARLYREVYAAIGL